MQKTYKRLHIFFSFFFVSVVYLSTRRKMILLRAAFLINTILLSVVIVDTNSAKKFPTHINNALFLIAQGISPKLGYSVLRN